MGPIKGDIEGWGGLTAFPIKGDCDGGTVF